MYDRLIQGPFLDLAGVKGLNPREMYRDFTLSAKIADMDKKGTLADLGRLQAVEGVARGKERSNRSVNPWLIVVAS